MFSIVSAEGLHWNGLPLFQSPSDCNITYQETLGDETPGQVLYEYRTMVVTIAIFGHGSSERLTVGIKNEQLRRKHNVQIPSNIKVVQPIHVVIHHGGCCL